MTPLDDLAGAGALYHGTGPLVAARQWRRTRATNNTASLTKLFLCMYGFTVLVPFQSPAQSRSGNRAGPGNQGHGVSHDPTPLAVRKGATSLTSLTKLSLTLSMVS